MEKRSKHESNKAKRNEESNKAMKNEENSMGKEEAQNVCKVKVIENVQVSENEDIAEAKRHLRRDKEKKKSKDPGAYGENHNGDAMNSIERKKKKKKKKREKNEDKDDIYQGGDVEEVDSEKWLEGGAVSMMKSCKESRKKPKIQKAIMNHLDSEKEGAKDEKNGRTHVENCQVNDAQKVERKKRKREEKRYKNDTDGESILDLTNNNESMANRIVDNENSGKDLSETISGHEVDFGEKIEVKKKKRRKKESNVGVLSSLEVDFSGAQQESVDDGNSALIHSTEIQSNEVESANKGMGKKIKVVENGCNEMREDDVGHAKKGKKKKKKTKLVENGSDDIRDDGMNSAMKRTEKRKKLVKDGSNEPTPNKSNKKVRFSDQDEVFPLPVDLNTEKGNDDEDNLTRGKRFTREEDKIVLEAVEKYIEEHDLGEEGLHMVLNCSKFPKLKGCWREIGSAIPYRPYTAVYYRAQILFRRSESRKWTQEECDEILKYQKEHGNNWKLLADELGKHRWHVKDTWRRIKLANQNKGCWSQDEYQKLFNLVNLDLQLKVSEEKKSKHGMLRDNIPWTAISDKLSTRSQANCCLKWYKQLTSSMVSEGLWADVDDYRMLDALYSLDATCMEDVDWDDLLDNRSGDLSRKRWNQMVLHIGQHGNKSFAEQVEVLAQRYCPQLLEARETWDSKPRLP